MDGITYSSKGRTYIKVSDTPTKRDIPVISIPEVTSAVPAEQVCRTCVNSSDRLWALTQSERSEAIRNNRREDFQCDPGKETKTYKHTVDGLRFEDWSRSRDKTVIGIVHGCGWSSKANCSSCVHFASTTIPMPYEQWKGGPVRFRQLTVAGHCKLENVCDYKRRPRALDPSCLNCEYLVNMSGDKWILDDFDRTVAKLGLDPFEMVQARKAVSAAAAGASDGYAPHPGVIFNQYTSLYTSSGVGLYRWFFGRLVQVRTKNGLEISANEAKGTPAAELDAIQVKFNDDNAHWFPIGNSDEPTPVGLIYWGSRPDTHFGYVRFYGTGYTKFGIKPSNTIKNYDFMSMFDQATLDANRRMISYEWTCNHGESHADSLRTDAPKMPSEFFSSNCSICLRSSVYVHALLDKPKFADRVDPFCELCKPDEACSAHARLLTRVKLAEDEYWYFADPAVLDGFDIHSKRVGIKIMDGRMVDHDGGPLHPSRVLSASRHMINNTHAKYTRLLRTVAKPSVFIVDRAREELEELVPYVEELRADLNSSKRPEVVERVIARLERQIAIAQSWLRANERALARIQQLKSERDQIIADITSAKVAVVKSLPTKARATVPVDVGWGRSLSVEPFKHYCALNMERVIHSSRVGDDGTIHSVMTHIPSDLRGINFREVMGDSFGLMRGTQWDMKSDPRGPRGNLRFSFHGSMYTSQTEKWADHMAMEERIRGTNPLERIQEESLINEAMIYNNAEMRINVPEPTEWRVIKLDMGVTESETDDSYSWSPLGKSIDDWAVYTPEADRALYREWLDQQVEVVMHTAEVDVDELITRDDLRTMWTNRWRVHGYENYRGHARRSKGEEAVVFSFDHHRQTTDELRSKAVQAFVCNLCDAQFTHEQIDSNLNCPHCEVPLVWVETANEDNVSVSLSQLPNIPKGRRVGIGFAVAADSPRYQNDTRLTRLCCEWWTLRGSAAKVRPTRLSDI